MPAQLYVQRIALHTADWTSVIYSQLAGNALSKIAPRRRRGRRCPRIYRMLVESGARRARSRSRDHRREPPHLRRRARSARARGPRVFLTGSVDRDLVTATVIGLGVLVLLTSAAIALLAFDEPLAWVGRRVQAIRNAIRRSSEPLPHAPDRLITERDRLLEILGPC